MKRIFKLLPLILLTGAVSGVIGALFLKALNSVTHLRGEYKNILLILPLAGLLSVFVNNRLKTNKVSTGGVLALKNDTPRAIVPSMFLSTVLTHLFGGSAGKEGAALQIGSGISATVSKTFKLNEVDARTLSLCGMGSMFSALFCTPFAASVFVIEASTTCEYFLLFPVIIASICGYFVSLALGSAPEHLRFDLPDFEWSVIPKILVIALGCVVICYVFLRTLKLVKKIFAKIANPYLRITVGAVIVIIVTAIIGNMRYNGGGMGVVEHIFAQGEFEYADFLFKIVLTAITLGCGFKGGEIVPTFFVGATFGALLSFALGLFVPLGACVGMLITFGLFTNAPIAAVVMSAELFGLSALPYVAGAMAVSYLIYIIMKKRS